MKLLQQIRVMAAYPSDVAEEAATLDSIASDLNRTIGDLHGIRFEILNWLRDVRPGLGSDAQDVINRQIGDGYEILIATFWTRAGTPTPRAKSGTIEEIEIAVAKARKNGNSPAILVYMKNAGAPILNLDIEQLRTLSDFRSWLNDNGILYKEFSDRTSYEATLRLDLAKVAKELAHDLTNQVASTNDEAVIEEELGLLDYLDRQDASFVRMGEIIEDQTQALNNLTSSFGQETIALNQVTANGSDRAELRRLLRRSSEAWNRFSDSSETRLLELRQVSATAYGAMSMAVSLRTSRSEGEAKLIAQLNSAIASSTSAAKSTRAFRDSTATFPRMTVEHNRAKRRLGEVLDQWGDYFEHNAKLAGEILDRIEKPR